VKSVFPVLAIGLLALVAQGGIATFVPPPYCPNLALLVAIAIGLHWPDMAGGLAVVTVLGYSTDLVSGSLMGQHAFIWLFVCASARIASRRLNLRGALPLAAFAAGVTFFFAGTQLFLTDLLMESSATLGWRGFLDVAKHAFANAVFAPAVSALMAHLLAWAIEDDTRQLELSPGRARI